MPFDDYDPIFHKFSEFIGLDAYKRTDSKLKNKLEIIYEWGSRKAKSYEPGKVIQVIKELIKESGTHNRGETLTKQLYSWIRMDIDSIRNEEDILAAKKQKIDLRERRFQLKQDAFKRNKERIADKKREYKQEVDRMEASEQKTKRIVKDYQDSIPKRIPTEKQTVRPEIPQEFKPVIVK